MYSLFVVYILLVTYASAQDCDYYQDLRVGEVVNVYNPGAPDNYRPPIQCRYIVRCPVGYICRLYCSEINIPQTPSCYADRFMVSRTGDPQLAAAETYCGRGTLNVVSTGRTISIGVIAPSSSLGGRYSCNVSPVIPDSSMSCQCGLRKQNRIVGGEETAVNEFKMMAGLVDLSLESVMCGGAIISQNYIVTAAHCVYNENKSNYAIFVGGHDVTDFSNTPGARLYGVRQFIIPQSYNPRTYDFDVALVAASSPIQFNMYVGPVCLPFKFQYSDFTGKYLTVLGWGLTEPGGMTSNVLRKANVRVISNSVCSRTESNINNRKVCTYTAGKDSCQRDSGGPLLYLDPSTGLLNLVAVVSSGGDCGSDRPSTNTLISSSDILSWIIAAANENFCVK